MLKTKLIALMLWIIIGWWIFIYQQFDSRNKFRNEVTVINEQIKKNIIEKEKLIQKWILSEMKSEIVDLLKREDFIVIKDYYKAYENFYNTLLRSEKYKDKIKEKEFLDTEEYKILETLKSATLVTEVHIDWEKKYLSWVPNNMNCNELKILAPCIKNEKIPYIEKYEVVYVDKIFNEEEVYDILNGDYKKFF